MPGAGRGSRPWRGIPLLVLGSCERHGANGSGGPWLKITSGEKGVGGGEVGAAGAIRLSNGIPLGRAACPQLPAPRPTEPWEDARELLPHCSCTKEIEHF